MIQTKLTLVRFNKDTDKTLGMLFIEKDLECYTLEPPWKDNEKNISCIPKGEYKYKKYKSKKYNCTCLALYSVPKRNYISIHYGNYPWDTEGCILLGRFVTVDELRKSRSALAKLNKAITDEGTIIIKEMIKV